MRVTAAAFVGSHPSLILQGTVEIPAHFLVFVLSSVATFLPGGCFYHPVFQL